MTSIDIPNSVTEIGFCAFLGCKRLTSIDIPNSVTSIGGYAFDDCIRLTSIDIPNSVTSIGDWAFQNCTSLTSVDIPYSVMEIGYRAFYGCESLSTVALGKESDAPARNHPRRAADDHLMTIGSKSFANCTGLTDVYLYTYVEAVSQDAFSGSSIGEATLHVPADLLDTYKTTAPWSQFVRVVPLDGMADGITTVDAATDDAQRSVYTIDGRRIDHATTLPPGLYIVDGRKVVVR